MNLEPLRHALMAEADGEEKRRLAEIDQTCEVELSAARARATSLTAHSRAEGERAAEQEARRRRGAASRRRRELRLAAQRELVDELRQRTLAAALASRGEPRYRALLARLERRVRSQLGSEVEIDEDPPGLGGVRARAGERSVDYTLPTLVERAIAGLGEEVAELWR